MSRAFAVVGPSGAGKDTLLAALKAARPDVVVARRVITRPATAGGEDFESVSVAEFATRVAAGDFVLHWQAHGLRYGIPASLRAAQEGGATVVFNGSRRALPQAAVAFAPLSVVVVEAAPGVLAQRLAARGREGTGEIAGRLDRAGLVLPDLPGVPVRRVDNSGRLDAALARMLALLD